MHCRTPSDVDELFHCYDETLRSLVDVHAPLRMISCRRGGHSARWYDGECRLEKAKTRRLERQYRRHMSPETLARWRQQFCRLKKLLQQKADAFWSTAISSCEGDSRAMWRKINALLSQPATTVSGNSVSISADTFATFFTQKVNSIRASTSQAPAPVLDSRYASSSLSSFEPVTAEEIGRLLKKVPAKQCSLDPVPTWLIKQLADHLAPVSHLCNISIPSGHLPDSQKLAVVHPRLKKAEFRRLCVELISNFISNLSFFRPQMRVGWSTTAIFGHLNGYFFRIFRDKACNII